ncbi:MAG: Re/Si-specific NAD(P)(+) transhydrogenase subunit alpha [Armatimonadota bacterium]
MNVGVVTETYPGERRVALVPGLVPSLRKAGLNVLVESGAGEPAGFLDHDYAEQGAEVVAGRENVLSEAEIVLQVRTLGANPEFGRLDLPLFRPGAVVIGHAEPLSAFEEARALAERDLALFALELIPRITRAQSMDVLSSQANLAGYKAVLLAAAELPRIFPMMMTAAGTIAAAKVLVVGAGVAGLQAIATAKRLGAVVTGFDVRPVVKEQVESLGARFLEIDLGEGAEGQGGYARELTPEQKLKQQAGMAQAVRESDVVITTAAVPGHPAPRLISADTARGMAPGSVIVDLAAERGGNCELTQAGETIVDSGVKILGPTNLPSTVPYHASQMYAKNAVTFLLHLMKDGEPRVGSDDEIIAGTLVTRNGEIVHPRVLELLGSRV